MSNKKSIKRNYLYNASYKILTLIAPLITTPYISRVLGENAIGDYSYTASVVGYFSMIALFGTYNYGNREIAYYQDEKEKAQRSKLFWEVELFSLLSTFVMVAAFLGFTFLLASKEYRSLYLIQIFSILAVAADISWLLQGLEEFKKVVGINMLFKVLNIAFIFLCVHKKEDILIYVAGMVVLTFLGNLTVWIYLPQFVYFPHLKKKQTVIASDIKTDADNLIQEKLPCDEVVWSELHPLRHLKPTFILFVPAIASSIYTMLDKTMIGLISNSAENGYYEQALKLSKAPLLLVTALESVMIPRMGECFKKNDLEGVKELAYRSYNFVWFLGVPLCFGLIGITQNLVPWFYGPGYEKINILLPILSLLILAIGISNVTGMQYFVSTKQENILTKTAIVGAVVNLCCNLVMIRMFASIGAAISSVIAETVITIVQFVIVRKQLSGARVLALSWKYLLAGAGMLVVLLIENAFWTSSILATCAMIVTGAATYFVLLLVMRDQFMWTAVEEVKGRLHA